MALADVSQLRKECLAALTEPAALVGRFQDLLQLVVDAHHAGTADVGAEAMSVLFDVACSGSGTVVDVSGVNGVQPPVGVLILGFAGASIDLLRPLIEIYCKRWPAWRVVTTVASGLTGSASGDAALEAQLDGIVDGLTGCRKVLVHVMSNNGHGLWANVLHRRGPALAHRVGALFYDCAAARSIKSEAPEAASSLDAEGQWAHVLDSTVWMQVMSLQPSIRKPGSEDVVLTVFDADELRGPIRTASLALEKTMAPAEGAASSGEAETPFWTSRVRMDGMNVFDFVRHAEPSVPCTCLTSDDDSIISRADVEDWAAFLRAAHAKREVRLSLLRGPHCRLHMGDPSGYAAELGRLVADSAIEGSGPPLTAAVVAGVAAVEGTPFGDALAPAGLSHLAALDGLAALDLDGACALYEAKGRPGFISECKRLGVAKLSERQGLASVLGKIVKERAGGA